ncbi:hypothetical protein CRM22_000203 [Opisthorchis felineus]|uniref:Uncharacterized protein n=1 Tax=Opisthorchis felineus TaxID=147828 RepID=A0A4S2MG32_OPIFE|nr:hypothetical protein CRM22_000203 [Opisthorchis felineus]
MTHSGMQTNIALALVGLLEVISARSLPEYDICVEKCGESPLDADKDPTVELCHDVCNKEENTRCLRRSSENMKEQLKCWKVARDRCVVRCGEEPACLLLCHLVYKPHNVGVNVHVLVRLPE